MRPSSFLPWRTEERTAAGLPDGPIASFPNDPVPDPPFLHMLLTLDKAFENTLIKLRLLTCIMTMITLRSFPRK